MSKLFIAVAVVMTLVSMVQADPCLTNNAGCQSTTGTPAVPAYLSASSGYINGKLQVALSVSQGYQAVAIAFNPDSASPSPYCNQNMYTCTPFWNETAAACTATLIGRFDAVPAIDNCFEVLSQDATTITYKSVIRVTAVQAVGTLRGRALNRTTIISFTLSATLPRTTSVTYNNLKTSNPYAVNESIIVQEFLPATRSVRLQLFTSVQFPYSLSVISQNTPTATYSLTSVAAATNPAYTILCNSNFASVCEQIWETSLSTSNAAACTISANINLLFSVNCRSGTNATLCATFTAGSYNFSSAILSSNFCPTVFFTGALSSTMLPYRTETGTVSTNGFILGERVFFQINVSSNIGSVIAATNVTSITINKSPFTATINAGETTGGFLLKNSAQVGVNERAVFSFILSTTTVPNPTEGIEDTVSVTANLRITYLTEVNKMHVMNVPVTLGLLKQLLADDDSTSVSSNILVTPPSVTATTQSTSSNALVVGVAVGAALLALVAILVLAVIVRRNKQNKETGTSPVPKEVE